MADVLREIQLHSEELRSHVHSELGPATINVGRIYGGEAANIVPPTCTIEVDRRLLPGETFDSASKLLSRHLERFRDAVVIQPPHMEAEGVYNGRDSSPCRYLFDACKAVHWQPAFETAHFATDASIFCKAGIPTAVFGPGSITLAHTKAEHVAIDQVERASEIVVALLTEE
jgi:acetylornithine deacetylase